VLLALDHMGMAGVVLEPAEIELDDDLAAGAIPDAEFRLDQAAPRHLLDEAERFQHLERGRMGGRGARAVIDAGVGLEQGDLDALAGERERRHDADGPAACNDDGTFGWHAGAYSDRMEKFQRWRGRKLGRALTRRAGSRLFFSRAWSPPDGPHFG
jgi:hypothetical protein